MSKGSTWRRRGKERASDVRRRRPSRDSPMNNTDPELSFGAYFARPRVIPLCMFRLAHDLVHVAVACIL